MYLDANIIDKSQLRGNVLVVEDIADQRQSLVEALDKRGLRVRSASSGSRALRICEREPVDIVVLDYQGIGRLDGLDVARSLQENYPTIQVVAHTAYGNTYRPRALELGLRNIADWVYKKPKSIENVINLVFEILSLKFQAQARQLLEREYLSSDKMNADGKTSDLHAFTKYDPIEVLGKLKQSLAYLKRPEIFQDLQQRQIQLSHFKVWVRDALWQASSNAALPQRNLVHMLKGVISQIDASSISEEQINALDYVLDLLRSSDLHLETVGIAKSMLQSANLDPILRVGEELENLKQLYRNSELNFEEGSED